MVLVSRHVCALWNPLRRRNAAQWRLYQHRDHTWPTGAGLLIGRVQREGVEEGGRGQAQQGEQQQEPGHRRGGRRNDDLRQLSVNTDLSRRPLDVGPECNRDGLGDMELGQCRMTIAVWKDCPSPADSHRNTNTLSAEDVHTPRLSSLGLQMVHHLTVPSHQQAQHCKDRQISFTLNDYQCVSVD